MAESLCSLPETIFTLFVNQLYLLFVCVLSRVWLFCDPMNYSPPGSSVHGIFQARVLEWVAISCSRGSSGPRDWTCISWVSCIGRQILYLLSHLGSPIQNKKLKKKRKNKRENSMTLLLQWCVRQCQYLIIVFSCSIIILTLLICTPPPHQLQSSAVRGQAHSQTNICPV